MYKEKKKKREKGKRKEEKGKEEERRGKEKRKRKKKREKEKKKRKRKKEEGEEEDPFSVLSPRGGGSRPLPGERSEGQGPVLRPKRSDLHGEAKGDVFWMSSFFVLFFRFGLAWARLGPGSGQG